MDKKNTHTHSNEPNFYTAGVCGSYIFYVDKYYYNNDDGDDGDDGNVETFSIPLRTLPPANILYHAKQCAPLINNVKLVPNLFQTTDNDVTRRYLFIFIIIIIIAMCADLLVSLFFNFQLIFFLLIIYCHYFCGFCYCCCWWWWYSYCLCSWLSVFFLIHFFAFQQKLDRSKRNFSILFGNWKTRKKSGTLFCEITKIIVRTKRNTKWIIIDDGHIKFQFHSIQAHFSWLLRIYTCCSANVSGILLCLGKWNDQRTYWVRAITEYGYA